MPRNIYVRFLAFLLLLQSTSAYADTPEARTRAIDVNLLRPSASRWAFVTTELTQTLDKWQWALGLVYDYQRRPLVLRSFGQRIDDIVSDEQTAHLLFSIGLPWKMELNVEVPIITRIDGSGGKFLGLPGMGHLSHQGFGDVRLTPKIQILKKKGFGLGFMARVALPTGKLANFWGERSVNVMPAVLLDYEWKRLAFTGSLGYAIRNKAEFNGLIVDDELIWALGAKFRILSSRQGRFDVDRLAVIGELYGRTAAGNLFKELNQNPMVGLLAARYFIPKYNLNLTAGLARGLQGGYGAPVIQPFLGVSWSPVEKDSDGDGIPDKLDRCPYQPGPRVWQGCPDTDLDGVPDHLDRCKNEPGPKSNNGCPIPDTDGDGIPDDEDKCPKQKGPKANKGCPWADTDGDGLFDNEDECPTEPGPVGTKGCPDKDKDGVPDKKDKCPDQPGPKENDGCPKEEPKPEEPKPEVKPEEPKPDEPKPEIKVEEKLIVLPRILFKLNSAEIQKESFGALNALARLLNENESVTLRIEGHTDDLGGKALNLRLSQKRAESVRRYLIAKEVKARRLVAIGLGNSRPISKERAVNRRVAFHITSAIPEGWKVKRTK
jgi:outer membrane protein OmpA-like peptidoglycan-associated protein